METIFIYFAFRLKRTMVCILLNCKFGYLYPVVEHNKMR